MTPWFSREFTHVWDKGMGVCNIEEMGLFLFSMADEALVLIEFMFFVNMRKYLPAK